MTTPSFLKLAQKVCPHWLGDPNTLTHVQTGGNTVYALTIAALATPTTAYLRLTPATFRTPAENQAEGHFVRYLAQQKVAVSLPIPTTTGHDVITLTHNQTIWSASLFTTAPRQFVPPAKSDQWQPALWHQWGRTLAQIHHAATQYQPQPPHQHWHWHNELWLRQAPDLLPTDDHKAHATYHHLISQLQHLPQTSLSYGLTHGDHAPSNFRYQPATQQITTFDFNNCGYHWFMWDIAVACSQLLWHPAPERESFVHHFLSGYRTTHPLPSTEFAHLDLFLQLRMLYVYLSRLWWFSDRPHPQQEAILARLQQLVHNPVTWHGPNSPTWRLAA